MKEAAGEANMTVITIVLIGVVAAVGMIIVPKLAQTIKKNSCCTNAGGKMTAVEGGATCKPISGSENAYDAAAYASCYAEK